MGILRECVARLAEPGARHALKGLGVGVPARRLIQDKLAQVLAEQDSRARIRAVRQPDL